MKIVTWRSLHWIKSFHYKLYSYYFFHYPYLNYQDPSMMHTGMDGHAYKYLLTFLKWWSSLILKTFTVPAETISSPNLFHSSQTLLAIILYFSTSNRYLFLNSLKMCPLLTLSPIPWKRFFVRIKINHSQYFEDIISFNSQDPQSVHIILPLYFFVSK